ncbi:MAG: hypothetical protein ABIU55_11370, partial [Ferruginibacter sp.]
TLLRELTILSPLQIQNLLAYRRVLGILLNVYELQAVPTWNLRTIKKILPYVTVSNQPRLFESLGQRLHGGENSILVRVSQTLEKSRGYLADPATTKNYYPGSPQKLFLRYKYVYKNLLQYGFVAEKDAGENFFKGGQKQGFDFYSGHFFMRNAGIVKSLALGDFTVNMGQGLTQWMSLAFKKGPDVLATKRQADVLRPYNSAGEIYFHRGAGITLAKNDWQATVFGSYRKLDANFIADTSQNFDDYISSLQTSGLHRTQSEVDDKSIQKQLAFGGNLAYNNARLHAGVNGIHYFLDLPLKKATDPYNLYALTGKSFGNYSVDYSYTFRNLHFFGEAAITDKLYKAFVNGLLISTASTVDISLFYRNISPGYQSLYTSAFTENTLPTNEKGFFTGVAIRPNPAWRVEAYADVYSFPWLKYLVNAPSSGKDYFVQFTYTPNKQVELYSRFKSETKARNYDPLGLTLHPVIGQPKQNWRTQVSFKVNPAVTLRSRAEMTWFDKKNTDAERGFLIYNDFIYKPLLKKYSGNLRLQYFETDGYNSRLYAYENDVLYYFSIPLFYGKGYRYYVNLNYDLTRKLSVWVKWSQYIYKDQNSVGSGLDLINGNKKSEMRFQAIYKF